MPLADACRPSWVIASPSFDAHRADPLTGLGLSGGDCADIMARLVAWAAPGRRVVVREGGYDLQALRNSAGKASPPLRAIRRPEPATSGGPGRAIVGVVPRLRAAAACEPGAASGRVEQWAVVSASGRRDLGSFDAMLFDLDGVITQTATVHAAAWKQLFDQFLVGWCRAHGQPFRPFDIGTDYVNHVDGRTRYEGVDTFLRSRGTVLPYGSPDDSVDEVTCCGLGNRKDRYFGEQLAENGAAVFVDAAQLIDALRRCGKRLAVVSASQNCEAVLRRVGLLDRFEARVTGVEAARLGLAGKPAPDTFLKAAELLGVEPGQAVVFEDAISGVQAGRSGRFGLVVGVDRRGDPEPLAANGADVVVSDLTVLLPVSANGERA